ncbi:isochorismatase family protein [Neisseriaceae bacterium JH1-16]|nr:isochorismatase family protein [Neisseriaceae bacterium JH1-16]
MASPDNIHLLIIDPQNDFCDLPGAALPVADASADLQRVAELIERHGERLSGITVTLDSHHSYDIAHGSYWRDAEGNAPLFTPIMLADVEAGRWQPVDEAKLAHVRAYLAEVELFIWPEHCLVGSWGHNIYAPLNAALQGWERQRHQTVTTLFKGLNPDTEHFSAFEADRPQADDPDTGFDARRIAQLRDADRVLVAGEALSHCVASSVRSLIRHLGPDFAARLVLLEDAASPVPGFEALGDAFVAEFRQQGGRLARCEHAFD